jgi:hypothetical protein
LALCKKQTVHPSRMTCVSLTPKPRLAGGVCRIRSVAVERVPGRRSDRLAFLSFSHALPPYGRIVCFQALDVSMTRFRAMGKTVKRPVPLRRPGGE